MSTDWVAMFARLERGLWRAKGVLVLVILPHVFRDLGDDHCSEQLAFTVNAEKGCIKRFDSTVSRSKDTLPQCDIVQSALLSSPLFSAKGGQTLGSSYHWRCEDKGVYSKPGQCMLQQRPTTDSFAETSANL